jgi:hypothetical protein
MSAGLFTRSRYEATYKADEIHPIRVQPESLLLASVGGTPIPNNPPADPINNDISASISLSGRSVGLRPRYFTLELPQTSTPPTGYAPGSITRVPILTEALFNAVNRGGSVTYLGVQWTVLNKTPERAA